MDDQIRVVVVDDHPLFRSGVVGSLQATGDIAVVGEAADCRGALRAVQETMPDLVLLDITMPGGGLTAAREISASSPSTRIVMLTVSEDEDDLLEALKVGAQGYVLKGVSARELTQVIRLVNGGQVYVSPGLAWGVLREMSQPREVDTLADLSAREREVLERVGEGLSNQEIGLRLGLAEKTVKHYMTNILSKLQVRSRVEAALLAHRARVAQESTAARGREP